MADNRNKKVKAILLSPKQLEGLSIISSDAGQVFLASMIAPLFTGVDAVKPVMLLSGLVLTIACYLISILLRQNI